MNYSWAIIAAAGTGERLGARQPKAFVNLGSSTILETTLFMLLAEGISNIVIAMPPDTDFQPKKQLPDFCKLVLVPGGRRRQDSVLNAAMQIPDDTDVVFIHDAARPFIRRGIVSELHAAAMKYGSAVPGIPCSDTLKLVADGFVSGTVSRSGLFAVQTPQAFRMDVFNSMLPLYERHDMTDDSTLAELLGLQTAIVAGSIRTFKITTPQDLELAEVLMREEI